MCRSPRKLSRCSEAKYAAFKCCFEDIHDFRNLGLRYYCSVVVHFFYGIAETLLFPGSALPPLDYLLGHVRSLPASLCLHRLMEQAGRFGFIT